MLKGQRCSKNWTRFNEEKYEPQKAFGITTPQAVAKWLGPEITPTNCTSSAISNKAELTAILGKFQLADKYRRIGGLP